MKYFLSLSLLLILPSIAFSIDSEISLKSPFEYTKWIRLELDKIKDIEPEVYFKNIDSYRSNIEKYIDHKKRVCNGEFSSFVLSSSNEAQINTSKDRIKNKLSGAEKKLCFRELKALQITMINNMFIARKRYLTYLHDLRLDELAKARDKIISSLQQSFSRSKSRR